MGGEVYKRPCEGLTCGAAGGSGYRGNLVAQGMGSPPHTRWSRTSGVQRGAARTRGTLNGTGVGRER